jgi:hypothetical protein
MAGPDASTSADASVDHATASARGDAAADVANGTGSSSSSSSSGGGTGAQSGNGPGTDGGVEPAASNPAGSLVRFADWAPDSSATGYDICTAAPGGLSWTGPMMGNAVRFPQVGRYVSLPAGSYDVRVVPPTSTDCSNPVAEGIGLPSLPANGRITYALVGSINPRGSDPPAALVALGDDVTAPAGQAALRFVNASPAASSVDFGTGSDRGNNFADLADDVLFGQAASMAPSPGIDAGLAPLDAGLPSFDSGLNLSLDAALSSTGIAGAPDGNGYLLLPPAASAMLSAHAVGASTDLVTGSGAVWQAATVNTVALINGGGDGATPQLLLCRDDAAPQGMLSACSVLGQ